MLKDASASQGELSSLAYNTVIYLSENAKEVIMSMWGKSENLGLPMTQNSHLFKNPRTEKPYNDFQVWFAKARAEVSLEDVRIHDLRHTYAVF